VKTRGFFCREAAGGVQ